MLSVIMKFKSEDEIPKECSEKGFTHLATRRSGMFKCWIHWFEWEGKGGDFPVDSIPKDTEIFYKS